MITLLLGQMKNETIRFPKKDVLLQGETCENPS